MKFPAKKRDDAHKMKPVIITTGVPIHGPGNAIEHIKVDFEIYQDGPNYIAYPLLNESDARLTGLPPSITFFVKDDWVNCEQKEFKYVAVDVYNELKKNNKHKT